VLAEIVVMSSRLIHFSTDYVFEGKNEEAVHRRRSSGPQAAFFTVRSKLAGRKKVLAAHDRNLVYEFLGFLGPDRPIFIDCNDKGGQEK